MRRALERLIDEHGAPKVIRSDNGKEFIATKLARWLGDQGIAAAPVAKANAQAVVDEAHQVIIATDLGECAADVGTLISMTGQVIANTGAAPAALLADAGYCSAGNLEHATEFTATHGTEFFIATGRTKRDDPLPAQSRGRIPNDATPKQGMARRLTTKAGRAAYARRKVIVEPVFGQMHTVQNGKHLLLRGPEGARGEWLLLAACHNLRKLHGKIGVEGLGGLATS